jgi:hypothetical protein
VQQDRCHQQRARGTPAARGTAANSCRSAAAPVDPGRAPREGPGIAGPSINERLGRLDWAAIERSLEERGCATTPPLLDAAECAELVELYPDERRFRSRIDMARYRFGVGEYKYFGEPLPRTVAALRTHVYRHLAPIANRWMEGLGLPERYPGTLEAYLASCAERGQSRPTPLLLHYTEGGYNCLHQDLYGALSFPLQLTCVLSQAGIDYTGGEILLVEQRPRAQSRGEVVTLARGEAVIFPTRHRPIAGTRGTYRATVRHGISRVRSGQRTSLGVIFHNAE